MYRSIGKRLFDITAALVLSVIFLPLFLLIMVIYIFFQGGIFFKQRRLGKNGKVFSIIKFRTLKEARNTTQARRFWFGDFLRFTSMDESPQLLNVLSGEMSLVGPRPLPVNYLPLFNDFQKRRLSVRPGVTGLAQIKGKNDLPWVKKFEYDIQYVNEVSLLLDLKILVLTILLLLSFKPDVSLNEKPFTGNP